MPTPPIDLLSTDPKVAAVKGNNTGGGGFGVWGNCDTGHGVHGDSLSSRGVVGTSQNFHGVFGKSTNNVGVAGESGAMMGVLSTIDLDDASLVAKARATPTIVGRDLAKTVMPEKNFAWKDGFK